LSRANEAYGIVDRGEQFGKIVLVTDLVVDRFRSSAR